MSERISVCGACGTKYEVPVFVGDAARLAHMSPMVLCTDGVVRCSRCYPVGVSAPRDARDQRAVA
jgi:hypothetical protein